MNYREQAKAWFLVHRMAVTEEAVDAFADALAAAAAEGYTKGYKAGGDKAREKAHAAELNEFWMKI